MKRKKIFKGIAEFFASLIFVENPSCAGCQKVLFHKDALMCDKCSKLLEQSAIPLYAKQERKVGSIELMGISIYKYEGIVRNLVHDFKYNSNRGLCRLCAERMVEPLKKSGIADKIDLIIPIPSSPQRLAMRGYNQAQLIADELSNCLRVESDPKLIRKSRETIDQTKLSGELRIENMRNAFSITDEKKAYGKIFLIIDDVITTGATISECAKTLVNAGAAGVYYATVAIA